MRKLIIPLILLALICGVIVATARDNYIRRNPIQEIDTRFLPKKIPVELRMCLQSHPIHSESCKRVRMKRVDI